MPLSPKAQAYANRVAHPIFLPLWMLFKLPSALFVGARITELSAARCVATVPYSWRSQNPFRSTYFAVQAMAAELSTGALVLLHTYDHPFSTLVVDMKATFGKKATSLATFTCEDGALVEQAVKEALETGEGRTVTMETVGRMKDGTEVSRFTFTWSVRKKGS